MQAERFRKRQRLFLYGVNPKMDEVQQPQAQTQTQAQTQPQPQAQAQTQTQPQPQPQEKSSGGKAGCIAAVVAALVVGAIGGALGGAYVGLAKPALLTKYLPFKKARAPESSPLAKALAREIDRQQKVGKIAFTVNGEGVSAAEEQAVIRFIRNANRKASDEDVKKAARERLVEQCVVAQAANKNIAMDDIETNVRLINAKRSALFESERQRMIRAATASNEEIKKLYEAEKKAYGTREYLFSHIALDSKKEADRVMGLLKKKGADFGQIASENSIDRVTREKKGRFGWARLAVFSKPLADLIGKTKVGAVGGPVKVDGHWQIVKVEETRPTSFKSLDELKGQLALQIKVAKTNDAIAKMVKDAKVE